MLGIYKGKIAHGYDMPVSMKTYQGNGHQFWQDITHVETGAGINWIMMGEELIPDSKNNMCKS